MQHVRSRGPDVSANAVDPHRLAALARHYYLRRVAPDAAFNAWLATVMADVPSNYDGGGAKHGD